MKVYTSTGIVFRNIKYGETSVICDIYTREKGLRSFIVSGVRHHKPGAKATILQTLNLVQVVGYDQEGDKLTRLKEVCLDHHYTCLNMDVVLSSMAIFILEIARLSIKEKESNIELYDFIVSWLKYLDDKSHQHPCLPLLFMMEMSKYLGFGPLDNYSNTEPCFDLLEGLFCTYDENIDTLLDVEDSHYIKMLLDTKNETITGLQINKSVRERLSDHLIRYYKLHIPGFRTPNSLPVLRSVFA